MSERLEEIKEAVQSWKHWGSWNDEQREVLEDILIYLKQSERVQELEKDIEHYKKAIKNYKESFEECEVISQHDRHQNKRYREAIDKIDYRLQNNTLSKYNLHCILDRLNEALESESE